MDKILNFYCLFPQVDVFNLSAVDLGTLSKVKIRQDDSGTNAAWHCSHVEVAVEGRPTRVFPCQRWLATGKETAACLSTRYTSRFQFIILSIHLNI